jgi:acyl-CoA thioesterase II
MPSNVLHSLVHLLKLERIEENLFRGQSQDLGWGQVFGGQVLGQALSAAVQTVPPERPPHSLHAYFLRPGDPTKPIVYDVDRARDGGSFTTRRVVAIQNGQQILNMSASFQVVEQGFEHQDAMPAAPLPDTLPTEQSRYAHFPLPKALRERATSERAFDLRTTDPLSNDPFRAAEQPPQRMVWLKANAKLPDDPALHRYLLAYVSDFSFMTASLLPHGVTLLTAGMQIASLDHAMWFHRPFRCDEWLLHAVDSPSASGARGFARGRVFNQQGELVASTAQEGLIRMRPPKNS